MGAPMAERLLKAGYDVSIWNRTRAKAEPLAAKGGKVVDKLSELAGCRRNRLHCLHRSMTSSKSCSARMVCFPVVRRRRSLVDCSTIAVEESADIRKRLKERGVEYIAAPVSGQCQGDQGRQLVVGDFRR